MKDSVERPNGFFRASKARIVFWGFCALFSLVVCSLFGFSAVRGPFCQVELQIADKILDEFDSTDISILRVQPHKLTQKECEGFAKLLFGDVMFYETGFAPEMTRTAKEAVIRKLRMLNNDEVIRDIYGTAELPMIKNVLSETIKGLKQSQLPEEREDQRSFCSWEFRPQSYYASNIPDVDDDSANQLVMAYVEDGPMSHKLWVTSRDESDFCIQSIYVYPNSEFSSPFDIETLSMLRSVCGYEKPSEIELESVLRRAEVIVGSVGIGDWTIVESTVECYKYWPNKESPLYVINVTAVPCFGGVKALHVNQLETLRGQNALSNYYYSEFLLTFSSSGKLLEATLTSPIDVVAVADSTVDAISPQSALDNLPSYIESWAATLLVNEGLRDNVGYWVKAVVDGSDWGFARVNTNDDSGDFLLVPAIQFTGEYALMYGEDVIYSYRDKFGKDFCFPLIRLADGTLIH